MIRLDIREREEFEKERIANSICCPLSQIDLMAPGILKNIPQDKIIIMCKSGKRSALALNDLRKFDLNQHEFVVYEGGLDQWKKEGKSVIGKRSSIPIMRQVQMVASVMIFSAFLGAKFLHPNFIYLALLVAFGLSMAGFVGLCPMAFLLQKMPWNKPANQSIVHKNEHNSCCG